MHVEWFFKIKKRQTNQLFNNKTFIYIFHSLFEGKISNWATGDFWIESEPSRLARRKVQTVQGCQICNKIW